MIKENLLNVLRTEAKRYISLFLFVVSVFSLLCMGPEFSGKEFLVNCAPLWLMCLLICLILYFLVIRRTSKLLWFGVVVFSIFFSWSILRVAHYYPQKDPKQLNCSQTISLLYANVLTNNQDRQKLNELIKEHNPQIVALVETDQAWIDSVQAQHKFPYYEIKPLDNNFGISLFSRLKIVGPTTIKIGSNLPPVIHTFVETSLPNQKIQIVVFHTFPPQLTTSNVINQKLLEGLSSLVEKSHDPIIMAGDLNATSFSDYYWRWVRSFNVTDSMSGFGWWRTWHAQSNFFRFTLDYTFVGNGAQTVKWTRLTPIGSDHFPLLTQVCIDKPV